VKFDVFISHATEDKATVAAPLARALSEQGFRVWIDEFSLMVGDSLRHSIDKGLSEARFGIVILSPDFLRKEWPKRELDALLARETGAGQPVVLPVWHNVSFEEVRRFSPLLADRLAVSTSQGIGTVAKAIAEAILIKAQGETQNTTERLESVIERLERLEKLASTREDNVTRPNPSMASEAIDEVFVVHGHDNAARESVCRFLEKVGTQPIVLAEKPSLGRTVIEKFEEYSDVKFAVVLLTPDDIGGVRANPGDLALRARQNVIFELGYFLGRLGRRRFCILNKGNTEVPSDMQGVVWIDMDEAHGWRISLAREMRAAGIRIDLNRVLE
jgi:predicted nucleotide-binding protein